MKAVNGSRKAVIHEVRSGNDAVLFAMRKMEDRLTASSSTEKAEAVNPEVTPEISGKVKTDNWHLLAEV